MLNKIITTKPELKDVTYDITIKQITYLLSQNFKGNFKDFRGVAYEKNKEKRTNLGRFIAQFEPISNALEEYEKEGKPRKRLTKEAKEMLEGTFISENAKIFRSDKTGAICVVLNNNFILNNIVDKLEILNVSKEGLTKEQQKEKENNIELSMVSKDVSKEDNWKLTIKLTNKETEAEKDQKKEKEKKDAEKKKESVDPVLEKFFKKSNLAFN